MSAFLGIDTSNYRTSVSILTDDGSFISNRRLLEVKKGELGLRQSDALFLHTRDLPELIEKTFGEFGGGRDEITAVGYSARPRDASGSYMPCFLAGALAARGIAAALGVPVYDFSHQAGHIAAAILSSEDNELFGERFAAFHLSGGTTEAVLVEKDPGIVFKAEVIGGSKDLKIGQAIDRVGVMLGLGFPAGAELDELAVSGRLTKPIKLSVDGAYCNISGLENICLKMKESGERPEDIARFVFEYTARLLEKLVDNIRKEQGPLPFLFAGGVSSNSIIRRRLSEIPNLRFASRELSSDNAVGTACLAKMKYETEHSS